MTNQEAIDKINAISSQLDTVQTEVQALKDQVANTGNISAELEAGINAVGAKVQAIDDMNP